MRERERERDNSNVKIRSHQRFITPPEGGSFRQLTSTWRKRELHTRAEKIQIEREEDNKAHKQKGYQALLADLALAHFLIG